MNVTTGLFQVLSPKFSGKCHIPCGGIIRTEAKTKHATPGMDENTRQGRSKVSGMGLGFGLTMNAACAHATSCGLVYEDLCQIIPPHTAENNFVSMGSPIRIVMWTSVCISDESFERIKLPLWPMFWYFSWNSHVIRPYHFQVLGYFASRMDEKRVWYIYAYCLPLIFSLQKPCSPTLDRYGLKSIVKDSVCCGGVQYMKPHANRFMPLAFPSNCIELKCQELVQ